MTPTDTLRDEHRVILKALGLLERAAGRVEAGAPVGVRWWATLVEWLAAFVDRRHHAKEERLLFPTLIEAGVPGRDGPIAEMLEEHARARALAAAMATGPPAYRVGQALDYVWLVRVHIDKENSVLLPLADAVLGESGLERLDRAFRAGASEEDGPAASLAAADALLDGLAAALEASVALP